MSELTDVQINGVFGNIQPICHRRDRIFNSEYSFCNTISQWSPSIRDRPSAIGLQDFSISSPIVLNTYLVVLRLLFTPMKKLWQGVSTTACCSGVYNARELYFLAAELVSDAGDCGAESPFAAGLMSNNSTSNTNVELGGIPGTPFCPYASAGGITN